MTATVDSDMLAARLDALGIRRTTVEHAAVFTVGESDTALDAIPGLHTKNLFLKDAAGRFWLVTGPAELRVDLKALPGVIGSKRVSFGKAEDMARLLGVVPGAVTPLGAVNDAAGLVTVVLDRRVAEADQVNVHPLRNTATIGLAGSDLVAALTAWNHPPLVVDLPGG